MKDRIDRFRKILKAKETARDLVRKELAELKRQEEAFLDHLRELRDEKLEYMRRFENIASGNVTIEDLRIGSEDISRTEDHIKEGIVKVLSLRKKMEAVEAALLERHRDVRKVETYLLQMELQWEKECQRKEQMSIDEIAGMLHHRRSGN
ncbi:MAG: flagellar FliJ family protein [Synergistota bacterium]|nr:flagellar FliJ family protein [Synergistota bacterium]